MHFLQSASHSSAVKVTEARNTNCAKASLYCQFRSPATKDVSMPSTPEFNPALVNWNGLHGLPRFEALHDGDFAAAFDAALASHERRSMRSPAMPKSRRSTTRSLPWRSPVTQLSRVSRAVLEQGGCPYQRRDPGAGARHFAEDVAALFEDRHECGALHAHRCAVGSAGQPWSDAGADPGAGAPLEGLRQIGRQAAEGPSRRSLPPSTKSLPASARSSARTCLPTKRAGRCSFPRGPNSPACPIF